MAYSLSFSPAFFLAEGEPYDRSNLALNKCGKPISVWSALEQKRQSDPDWWDDLAREVFGCEGKFLDLETVLEKIEGTDTCGDLSSPVDVWIDPDGDFVIEVYDAG